MTIKEQFTGFFASLFMLLFPNAKINIGLSVLNKREDGFHNLESVFVPIPLFDTLEFIETDEFKFESSIEIPTDKSNSVIKAYELLKAKFDLPPISIYLLKNIPTGAGLGGGSADGSFMLTGLNSYFNLGLSISELKNYALKIGSDCPFFIENKPKFVTGKGESMENISICLSNKYIALINPKLHISTKSAFQGITPYKNTPSKGLKEIITSSPISSWKGKVKNDFEETIFDQHPEIEQIKQELYNQGALFASMTGTGSTVFGLFENEVSLTNLDSNYFVKTLPL